MRVLVLASATGLAHISRSLELAKYLRNEGLEVHFACANGPWSDLAAAYGFARIRVHESRLHRTGEHKIGIPKSSEMVKAFHCEVELIQEIKPDVVVSDWRLTTWISTRIARAPCVQIWNSNWGLLSGYPEFVDPVFQASYKQTISFWKREIDSFLDSIGMSQVKDMFILRGERNIIPDHLIFRGLIELPETKDYSFVGPLVPWPDSWEDGNGNSIPNSKHDITIAFGGHHLPGLRQLVMDAAIWKNLRVCCLPNRPPRMQEERRFSFFPSMLLQGHLVVTHGGIGSIYQALLACKPVLVIPQHLEHLDNGWCVERLGVGVCIQPEQLCRNALATAFDFLINSNVVEKVREVSRELRGATPYHNAARLVLEVL